MVFTGIVIKAPRIFLASIQQSFKVHFMSNQQPPEPKIKNVSNGSLDFHSMFFTIQGEGPFSGYRSIFVRLAGCNLQCPGCDTEYTQGRERVSLDWLVEGVETLARAHNAPRCLIVITGGEPLRQDIGVFVQVLVNLGHKVQIESNGVFAPSKDLTDLINFSNRVTYVVSPKTKHIHKDARELASCFKYVLDHRSVNPDDGLPMLALEHPAAGGVARPRPGATVYVNPYDASEEKLDGQNILNLKAAAASCLEYGYILGVQVHKLAGLA